MIETIATWIGLILMLVIVITIIGGCVYYLFNKFQHSDVYFKALVYHLLSEKKDIKKEGHKIDMRVGRKWCTKFKGKWITWEIVEMEE